MAEKDTRSRKWQLTINNPVEKGFTHEVIKEKLQGMKSLVYFCMADEQGNKEETRHTHVYACYNEPVRFSTIKNAFPEAHIEQCKGTSQQNRDYIAKEGKWENDEKHGTKIDGTFEEWGEMPQERQGARNDIIELYTMIKDGKSNCEIYEENPKNISRSTYIDRVRQDIRYEEYRDTMRTDIKVTYIYGRTGTGKTRSIYSQHCPREIYRITDYKHPFDAYQAEPVIVFDEYRSQLQISEMLNLLDIYPLSLPCRYVNKQACYTQVYIISNEPIRAQYQNIQNEKPATWQAFLRRIHTIYRLTEQGMIPEDASGKVIIPDWVKEAEQAEEREKMGDTGEQLELNSDPQIDPQ